MRFEELHPIVQALLGTSLTWGLTALGAATVFSAVRVNRKVLDAMMGFASGVMIAASYWSLLAPSIDLSRDMGFPAWWPPIAGFAAGGIALWALDRLLPHLHPGFPPGPREGPPSKWQRSLLLMLAITLHNIPEGLAVGVAFGAAASGLPSATLAGAVALTLGIGLQNIPEGLAVALPLRGEGMSRRRSFFFGQASALVEPLAGVLGAAAVLAVRPLLPFALSFAAGAMLFVVIEELIPESQNGGNTDVATLGALLGFAVMMALDVGLG
ncbi:MAG: ZIP family metal transporter [Anaerolineales bacterium]